MPRQEIRIQNLDIRTRGLPEHTVRAALSGLESALQAEISRHPGIKTNGSIHLSTLKLSPIQARGDTQQLRQTIARQVLRALTLNPSPDGRGTSAPLLPREKGPGDEGSPNSQA